MINLTRHPYTFLEVPSALGVLRCLRSRNASRVHSWIAEWIHDRHVDTLIRALAMRARRIPLTMDFGISA